MTTLKIACDTGVLVFMIYLLQRDETPDLAHVFFVALGMAIANLVCALLLVQIIGVLVIVPILIIDGLILMYFCHMTIKHALITLGVLLVYNVAFQAVFS